jgi:hypothetical protein
MLYPSVSRMCGEAGGSTVDRRRVVVLVEQAKFGCQLWLFRYVPKMSDQQSAKRPKQSKNLLASRIKRLMQADDEVGKIAQATPIVIGKALA